MPQQQVKPLGQLGGLCARAGQRQRATDELAFEIGHRFQHRAAQHFKNLQPACRRQRNAQQRLEHVLQPNLGKLPIGTRQRQHPRARRPLIGQRIQPDSVGIQLGQLGNVRKPVGRHDYTLLMESIGRASRCFLWLRLPSPDDCRILWRMSGAAT